ncbi:MAG: hypothetical protein GY708_20295 [Actinomycetia bacterium]|nr:hypothetical protein [Actinomycetes bacterium]
MGNRRAFVIFAIAFALLATSCSGDESDEGDAITIGDQSNTGGDGGADDGDGGDGEGGAANSNDDSTSGSSDLEVVWPLPTGDYEVFLPYQLIEDEFQYSESASFLTTNTSVEDVLAFYREYFPTIGLIPNELELGESIALNLTDPDDPLWSGVMQTGADADGKVTISQNYTDPTDPTDTVTTDAVDGSSDSDGAGTEDD